jgi:formate dehydrogenase major subunit
MTRRTTVLDAIEPVPVIYVNAADLENLGVSAGEEIVARSRRGEIRAYARPDGALKDAFPTANGKARLVAAKSIAPDEEPDAEYPLILITGRQLEHWHTGSMTRRTTVLDAIEPVPVIYVNVVDLENLGVAAGEEIVARSRRGEIRAYARPDGALKQGEVFIPFCYHEAAANLLTNEALDPFGKIPEFKFCAIKLEAA